MKFINYIKIFLTIATMMVMVSMSLNARAEGEQLYFVGMVSPTGSISNAGAGSTAVYLRWDTTEGQLPADLSEFKLMRDSVEIYRVPAFSIMNTAAINNLYTGAQNSRRFSETLRWLNAMDTATTVTAGNFAQVLGNKLATDNFWSYFATRVDFNVAQARHRAYLDTSAPVGVVTYELIGVSTVGTEARIGRVKLDTGITNILPQAGNLSQLNLGRCDSPSERFKSHGTVALNWQYAGGDFNNKFVNSILVAGFDIYRDTANVSTLTPRDIRSLASTQTHDSNGNVILSGLEKVNDQPILISGEAQTEEGKGNWKTPFAQFVETLEELAARGIKPGDRRGYYLVSRDITGNYGSTASLLVTVPDLNPPPAPWSVRTAVSTADNKFQLRWDQVNVANYHEDHKNSRTYCNLDTARFDRELSFVSANKSCDNTRPVIVDLDVVDYLVYRFINITDASKFSDTDGDGYSDAEERGVGNTPGTSCVASSVPGGGTNFQIATIPIANAVTRPSSRAVIEFVDPSPPRGVTKDDVFWYRIASRDRDGNISDLSEPVRGFFPERKKPSRSLLGDGFTFGVQSCNYDAKLTVNATAVLPFAVDKTADATHIRVSCPILKLAWNYPLSIQFNGQSGVSLSTEQCDSIKQQCSFGADNTSLPFTTGYHSKSGAQLASVAQPVGGWNCSNIQGSELNKTCNTIQSVQPGDVVTGPLVFNPPAGFKDCVKFYRDINGKTYHHKTFCPPLGGDLIGPIVLDVPTMGGEFTCMSAAVQNQNGEVSAKYRFPCVVIDQNIALSAPTPLDIQFTPATDKITLSWIPPEQAVVGSFVEWYWKAADVGVAQSSFSRFFPHSGKSAIDGTIQVNALISLEQSGSDWEEEWCFRSRSVGQTADQGNEALSEWSAEVCKLRLPVGQSPSGYLAWPQIAAPELQSAATANGLLPARYLQIDNLPVVELSLIPVVIEKGCDAKITTGSGSSYQSGIAICNGKSGSSCFANPGTGFPNSVMQCESLCSSVQAGLAGKLNFVAYRQSATDKNTAATFSNYVQVSPLIERAYCKTTFTPGGTGLPRRTSILNDPFIKLAEFTSSGSEWNGMRAMFVDNYPHINGQWYRYQFVRFDAKGEISNYQQTDWIQAQ